MNVTRFAAHPGDYALFVDPKDGAGYVLYSAGFYVRFRTSWKIRVGHAAPRPIRKRAPPSASR